MIKYDIQYLINKSRMVGNLDALQHGSRVIGNKSHWSWKPSEVLGRHKLYRHIDIPIHNNSQFNHNVVTPVGTVEVKRDFTGKHDLSVPECPSFYDRNNLSQSAKRKRAKMSQFARS